MFELPSGSNKLTTLVAFTGDNGAYPISSILVDHDGNLFGTTSQGGTDDAGTIFKLTRVDAPGDYDDNGIVDHADYDLWSRTFGSTTNLAADGNGNGIVDTGDYTTWRDHVGSSAGGTASPPSRMLVSTNPLSAAVPEPAALMLMTLGLVGLCFHQCCA